MSYSRIGLRLTYIFLFCRCFVFSQNVTVTGLCHDWYKGKRVELWHMSDFVTMNHLAETADTVSDDGTFELSYHASSTRPVFLKVSNYTARLYVQPDKTYTITLPEPDESQNINKDVDLLLNIGILGYDSMELNALIFDFQRQYNKLFLPDDERYLGRASMFRRTDSLQRLCDQRYKRIQNPYFSSYVTYFIASLNASLSRGEQYLITKYVAGKPLQYEHFEYMHFFGQCFRGYLKGISSKFRGQSLYNIINDKADYNRLGAFMKQEKAMASDSLRELVTLVNLWEFYFSSEFNRDAIESMVSQLYMQTENEAHKQIARNMLAYFGRLQPGSPAPDFSARTKDGRMGSFSMFRGKWVYLNFFSSANPSSMKEMMKIVDLKRRYGHKVTFLSVCLDDSLASYKKMLRDNPKFDWHIWYNNGAFTRTAKQHYAVTGTEAYFFISGLGDIVQNPAPSPSQGIEYKFNVIFKIKQRQNRSGFK